ncbi:MAG: hypothetical protein NZ473_03570 [Candidatus Kapabacteria bacterium]|nr:hypothetical protein [Candidatus Kapabacteria bacterium]MDW8224722.1 FlgD immunoglobulin-like domain containing protein [Bacteroidota bacterium]
MPEREDFLRLLIAQLRAQSPIRPYEGQELAVQLAIFSQLEQLLSVRQLLGVQVEQLSGLTETLGNVAAPALVGTYVRVGSSELRLSADKPTEFGYELQEAAQSVRVDICTPSGQIVRSLEFREVPPGVHDVEWDGRSASGERLPPGIYTVRITAVGKAGHSVKVTPYVAGTVEAVRFTAKGAMLRIGGIEVPLVALLEIRKQT